MYLPDNDPPPRDFTFGPNDEWSRDTFETLLIAFAVFIVLAFLANLFGANP